MNCDDGSLQRERTHGNMTQERYNKLMDEARDIASDLYGNMTIQILNRQPWVKRDYQILWGRFLDIKATIDATEAYI